MLTDTPPLACFSWRPLTFNQSPRPHRLCRAVALRQVISGANEAVTPSMYFGNGMVTEFDFSRKLCPNVKDDGKLGYLSTFGPSWGLMPSDLALTFIDNHDTEVGAGVQG
jgi:alpha-amylase